MGGHLSPIQKVRLAPGYPILSLSLIMPPLPSHSYLLPNHHHHHPLYIAFLIDIAFTEALGRLRDWRSNSKQILSVSNKRRLCIGHLQVFACQIISIKSLTVGHKQSSNVLTIFFLLLRDVFACYYLILGT